MRRGMFSGAKNPMFGKSFSEEHRRKISESNKGKHIISEKTRQKLSEAGKKRWAKHA